MNNVLLNAGIHNRFDVEVTDKKTGKVKQRAFAENVICNNVWQYMFTDKTMWNSYIQYGSGSGTPAVTDTQLFSKIAGVATGDGVFCMHSSEGVATWKTSIVLTETVSVGQTITEVGIAKTAENGTLCTHAMLQDMNGNPVSIAKTNTDIITIYATVYCHFPATVSSHFALYHDPTSWKSGFFGWLFGKKDYHSISLFGLDFSVANGLSGTVPSVSAYQYLFDAPSKKVTVKYSRLAASDGNQNYCKGITVIDSQYSFSFRVDPSWYPYTQITGEALGTGDGETVDFATKFKDVYDATVYVDGVPQSGVTADELTPLGGSYMSIFELIQIVDVDGITPRYSNLHSVLVRKDEDPVVLFNPHNDKFGITGIEFGKPNAYCDYAKLETSDDLVNWTVYSSSVSGHVTFSGDDRFKKYYKITATSNSSHSGMNFSDRYCEIVAKDGYDMSHNIHLSSPPQVGAAITIDYKTKTIAKDENHVLDTSIEIQLGEYTE